MRFSLRRSFTRPAVHAQRSIFEGRVTTVRDFAAVRSGNGKVRFGIF